MLTFNYSKGHIGPLKHIKFDILNCVAIISQPRISIIEFQTYSLPRRFCNMSPASFAHDRIVLLYYHAEIILTLKKKF